MNGHALSIPVGTQLGSKIPAGRIFTSQQGESLPSFTFEFLHRLGTTILPMPFHAGPSLFQNLSCWA